MMIAKKMLYYLEVWELPLIFQQLFKILLYSYDKIDLEYYHSFFYFHGLARLARSVKLWYFAWNKLRYYEKDDFYILPVMFYYAHMPGSGRRYPYEKNDL